MSLSHHQRLDEERNRRTANAAKLAKHLADVAPFLAAAKQKTQPVAERKLHGG